MTTSQANLTSFTYCFRFNLEVLSGLENEFMGTLINIGDWYDVTAILIEETLNYTNFRTEAAQTYNDGTSRDLLFMTASSQISVVNFGYPATRTTYNSYLLRDREGNYDIYSPYVWNHVCFSFERGGYSRVVLV